MLQGYHLSVCCTCDSTRTAGQGIDGENAVPMQRQPVWHSYSKHSMHRHQSDIGPTKQAPMFRIGFLHPNLLQSDSSGGYCRQASKQNRLCKQ